MERLKGTPVPAGSASGRSVQRNWATLLERTKERLHSLGAARFDAMVLEDNDVGKRHWLARGYTRQPR